ncbi:Hypothetical protein HDN1F_19540 [gamma proteobacterium HdN1]|nr:Hypothetical protein HDN1F_19540 [gamma proteobacterium HdN1]
MTAHNQFWVKKADLAYAKTHLTKRLIYACTTATQLKIQAAAQMKIIILTWNPKSRNLAPNFYSAMAAKKD